MRFGTYIAVACLSWGARVFGEGRVAEIFDHADKISTLREARLEIQSGTHVSYVSFDALGRNPAMAVKGSRLFVMRIAGKIAAAGVFGQAGPGGATIVESLIAVNRQAAVDLLDRAWRGRAVVFPASTHNLDALAVSTADPYASGEIPIKPAHPCYAVMDAVPVLAGR